MDPETYIVPASIHGIGTNAANVGPDLRPVLLNRPRDHPEEPGPAALDHARLIVVVVVVVELIRINLVAVSVKELGYRDELAADIPWLC